MVLFEHVPRSVARCTNKTVVATVLSMQIGLTPPNKNIPTILVSAVHLGPQDVSPSSLIARLIYFYPQLGSVFRI